VERIRCESSLSKSVAAWSRTRRGASSRQSGVYARALNGDFSPCALVPRSRASSGASASLEVSAVRQRDFTDRAGEPRVFRQPARKTVSPVCHFRSTILSRSSLPILKPTQLNREGTRMFDVESNAAVDDQIMANIYVL